MQEKIFYGKMRIKYGFEKKMTLNLIFISEMNYCVFKIKNTLD